MSNGTPLSIGPFAKLAGTAIANLPREMDSRLALDFAKNGDALEVVLAEALTRANLDRALVVLGKKQEPKPVSPTESNPQPVPFPMSVVIDSDLTPNIPSGLYLSGEGTEHRKMGIITLEKRPDGKLYVNGREVVRFYSPNQQNGTIGGHKLRKELKDKQVLNACILDALFKNPQLIPSGWETGYTYFWGTIFRDADGDLFVGCLRWHNGGWHWGDGWLGGDWDGSDPAALL